VHASCSRRKQRGFAQYSGAARAELIMVLFAAGFGLGLGSLAGLSVRAFQLRTAVNRLVAPCGREHSTGSYLVQQM
jgi:hypothetical protein